MVGILPLVCSNCVKEIVYPAGGEIDIRAVKVGDATMSVLEIWGAEYQENDCLLIKPESRALLEAICKRERCLMTVIGRVTGDGRIVLKDTLTQDDPQAIVPEDLELERVLGKMPNKRYELTRQTAEGEGEREGAALVEAALGDATVAEAIGRVLSLPSVCSKRFLTTKVDRSVTGLVAQQQCVGPLQVSGRRIQPPNHSPNQSHARTQAHEHTPRRTHV